MKRLAAILLLLSVAALGSGALRYLHERSHAASDAHCHHGDAPRPWDHAPVHDPATCFVHAMLKLPMLGGTGHVPVLVLFGAFIAFLTSLPAPVLCRRPVLLLDSRGPPVG